MSEAGQTVSLDVVIFGGGVAGLWLLNRLRQSGYQAVLLETESLGAGQTRYAQGIIHGGTKYALTGKLTASSEAVFDMPGIWRNCLEGKGEIDLQQARTLSPHMFMWSTASFVSRLASFVVSRIMRSRTQPLLHSERPVVFQERACRGQVYQLDEPVLDTQTIIHALAEPCQEAIVHYQADSISMENQHISFTAADGKAYTLQSRKVVLAAGRGNAALLQAAGRDTPAMQLRPLKMVMVRGNLPSMLYAHCIRNFIPNPYVTITSHTDSQGDIVWYLGGQLAEDGVQRSDEEQIMTARESMQTLMPWVDFTHSQWAVLPIDRAEPQQPGGKRPDNAFASMNGNIITAWPTKLALSPKLADDVLQLLENEHVEPGEAVRLPSWPAPPYARLPWQEEFRWN